METELKTSKDWNQIHKVNILDPDGWDRQNYDYSFNEELITETEFNLRVLQSTIEFKIDSRFPIWLKEQNIYNEEK